ncbi:hypothetical protein [Orrella marina]|nr:hypothetical protein [Orrella marina]
MILMFLVMVFVHALLPLLGAWLTRSRSGVVLGGVVAAIVGLVSATPILMGAGVAGLLLGMWSGFSWLKRQESKKRAGAR